MPRFKFWAGVYAACASLPLFVSATLHEDVLSSFLWATALVYGISVALFTVNNWFNARGARRRRRSVDGKLLPMEYFEILDILITPPTELSALDEEALKEIPGWALGPEIKKGRS